MQIGKKIMGYLRKILNSLIFFPVNYRAVQTEQILFVATKSFYIFIFLIHNIHNKSAFFSKKSQNRCVKRTVAPAFLPVKYSTTKQ